MKPYNTAQRLRQLMTSRNLRQVDILRLSEPFCEKYGVKLAKNDLSQYVSGKVEPGQDKLSILGMALNVSEVWLMGYDVPMEKQPSVMDVPPGFEPMPEMAEVPLIGNIACGEPILAIQNIEDTVNLPAEWKSDFALRCHGDSMSPRIEDGDLVAIHIQPTVETGEIAAVRIDDEATLKAVYLHDNFIELRPLNPAYSSIIRPLNSMEDIAIEGKAVGLCRGL